MFGLWEGQGDPTQNSPLLLWASPVLRITGVMIDLQVKPKMPPLPIWRGSAALAGENRQGGQEEVKPLVVCEVARLHLEE